MSERMPGSCAWPLPFFRFAPFVPFRPFDIGFLAFFGRESIFVGIRLLTLLGAAQCAERDLPLHFGHTLSRIRTQPRFAVSYKSTRYCYLAASGVGTTMVPKYHLCPVGNVSGDLRLRAAINVPQSTSGHEWPAINGAAKVAEWPRRLCGDRKRRNSRQWKNSFR